MANSLQAYQNRSVLLVSQSGTTAMALADRLGRSGARVSHLEVRDAGRPAPGFDVSAQARLSTSLARATEDRSAIRRFVHSWFAAHERPDWVILSFRQSAVRDDLKPEGAPLRHFVAAAALIECIAQELGQQGKTRLTVCVGLDGHDFFGPYAGRIGYRALESYLKTWQQAFEQAGIAAGYTEYLDPERSGETPWPDGGLTGLLRSLHPYTPEETARQLLETMQDGKIGHKPLRTEALFWLSRMRRPKEEEREEWPRRPFQWPAVAPTGS